MERASNPAVLSFELAPRKACADQSCFRDSSPPLKMKHAASPVEYQDGGFILKAKRLRGLLPTQKERYYHRYSYKRAKYVDCSAPKPIYGSLKKEFQFIRSRDHGVQFDEQLKQTIDMYCKYKLPTNFFTCKDVRRVCPRIPSEVKKYCNNLLPYTIKFWQLISQRDLKPVASQLPVGHEQLRVGTACDVVCQDSKGRMVVIETKCGFETYYCNCTEHKMSKPLDELTDCCLNQHLLQLHHTVLLYRHTFKLRPKECGRSFVARFSQAGVDVFYVPDVIKSKARLELLQ